MLTSLQRQVFEFVRQETIEVGRRFNGGEDVVAQQNVVAAYAYALYLDLVGAGNEIHFSESVARNRDTSPSDVGFFRHLHVLQDFILNISILDR